MAKIDEGDTVRIKRSLKLPDGTFIRAATEGTVEDVSGGWGSKKYKVKWRGVNFTITHSAKDIVLPEV